MKMKTFLIAAAAVMIATPALAAVDGPDVNWRFACFGTKRAATIHMHSIKDYVEKETNGKFKIDIGYGTFGDPKEYLDLLKIGSINGACAIAGYAPGKTPGYNVFGLPLLPDTDFATQIKVREAVNDHPAIRAEFAKWNAYPFMAAIIPQYYLIGKGDVPKSVDDLKGLRVRSHGGMGDALKLVGAVPTSMPAPEIYVSLERGALDAVAFPHYATVSFKVHELANWVITNLPLGSSGTTLSLNLESWNGLPEQYKELLNEAKTIAYEDFRKATEEDDEKALATMKEAGIEMVQFSDKELATFRKQGGEPLWNEWVKETADKAPAQELLDLVLEKSGAKM